MNAADNGLHPVTRGARWAAVFAVRFYQAYLSRIFGGQCRFRPSCSEYCIACVECHGVWRGGWYSLRRLVRCHPFCRGGDDPVPPSPGCHSTVR